MSTVINPHIALLIRGVEDWDSDEEETRLDMDIQVEKDQDGEPNEASVTVYNLNADTRNRIIDPAVRDTPIEIFFAPFGTDERVSCFVGEIETKRNEQLKPGLATHLVCKSQRWQSRDKYIKPTTYEAGTPIKTIMEDLIEVIGLPSNIDTTIIALDTIVRAQTVSGPAFLTLRRFVEPYGLTVFICDALLTFSDVFEVPNPTVISITDAMLTGPVEPTERQDAIDVLARTVVSATTKNWTTTELKRKRKKRKTTKKAAGETEAEYTEYETVDGTIFGVTAELLGGPTINPDNIVQFEGNDQYYRVRTVTHAGDTKEGVLTVVNADIYEEDVIPGGAF